MGGTVTELASAGYGRALNAPHANILHRAMWSFRVRRRIRRTPRVAIAELQEGVVACLVGRAVRLDELLEAPVTGRRCVYYRVTVEDPAFGLHRTLGREECGVVFALDDGARRAIIDPSHSIVDLAEDRTETSGDLRPPNRRQTALLARVGVEQTMFLNRFLMPWDHRQRRERPLLYRETAIEIGATIAILGEAVHEPDPDARPDGTYRGIQPTRVRMTSSRRRRLMISDHRLATT